MRRIITTSLLLTIALAACGTRGPLTLPPPQAAVKAPAPAKAPATPSADANTTAR